MKRRIKNKVASGRISLALLVAGVLGVAGLSQADAGTRDPRVNQRQQH